MSERQKIHARQFNSAFNTADLRDISKSRDEQVISEGQEVKIDNLNTQEELKSLSCTSSAVLIGTAEEKESQFTENGGFIFTDYTVAVNQIFKQDDSRAIKVNDKISVSNISGAVISHGHRIEAFDDQNRPLRPGQQYLIFLGHINGSSDYKGASPR